MAETKQKEWHQSPVLWGCATTVVTIVIGALAVVLTDARWLLGLAWPFAGAACWEFIRLQNLKHSRSWTAVSFLFCGLFLGALYFFTGKPQEAQEFLLGAWTLRNEWWFPWVISGTVGIVIGAAGNSSWRRRSENRLPIANDGTLKIAGEGVVAPRPISEEAPRFREDLGKPIENEWWASLYRVASEARAQNNGTPYGHSLGELSLPDQTAEYAGKINEYIQLYGTPPGPQLSEPIMARGDQIKFRINGMQMDSVDSKGRAFYRYIHLRSTQVADALAQIRKMATDISPFALMNAHSAKDRSFTSRTAAELLEFYRRPDLTPLQAGELIAPYLGLWIKVEGIAHRVLDGGGDIVAMVYDNDVAIECRFIRLWETNLMRINPSERIRVTGQISPSQNGAQLYLRNCELDFIGPSEWSLPSSGLPDMPAQK